MERFLNFGLMKHPMNWVILTLMYFIAVIAWHVASGAFGIHSQEGN